MLYYTLYTEGLDAIARHYIRQQADDPTAHDRWQAAFAKLVQAVLDANPATLPTVDIGLAPRGWLDCQALVLPYSTSWEKARREAVAVMGYTDRVQL